MHSTMRISQFVSTYAQLTALPAGSLALDPVTGSTYRVCQGQYGAVQVVQLSVQGSARVVGAPAGGKAFGNALAVVYTPAGA